MFDFIPVWAYWLFGGLFISFNLLGVLLVLFGSGGERKSGEELLIKTWIGIAIVIVFTLTLAFVIKPLMVLLAHPMWYSF